MMTHTPQQQRLIILRAELDAWYDGCRTNEEAEAKVVYIADRILQDAMARNANNNP